MNMKCGVRLGFVIVFCAASLKLAGADANPPPGKTQADKDAEKKKKEEEAKKKAEEAKKKAEEAKKKKEEAAKKATDFKTWTARNFNDIKQTHEPLCIYIKDPEKNNKEAAVFESANIFASEEVRGKLLGFTFSKLATNDKLAPSYPAEWIQRAKTAAILVLASGDLQRLFVFDAANVSAKGISTAIEDIRRLQDAKKAAAEEQKKKEDAERKAKFAEEVKKSKSDDIPGLDKTASKKTSDPKAPKKPGSKEPVDE